MVEEVGEVEEEVGGEVEVEAEVEGVVTGEVEVEEVVMTGKMLSVVWKTNFTFNTHIIHTVH